MGKTYRKNKHGHQYQDKDRKHGILKPSRGCLNGGDCDWCLGNRTHSNRLQQERAEEQLREYLDACHDNMMEYFKEGE